MEKRDGDPAAPDTEQWLVRLAACVIGLGIYYEENVRRLTAVAGELLGGSYVVYTRLDGTSLRHVARWLGSAEPLVADDVLDPLCRETLTRGGLEPVVRQALPQASEAHADLAPRADRSPTYVGQIILSRQQPAGVLSVLSAGNHAPIERERSALAILASAIGAEEQRRRAEQFLERERETLEWLRHIMMDRELRIVELKQEADQLRCVVGLDRKYVV